MTASLQNRREAVSDGAIPWPAIGELKPCFQRFSLKTSCFVSPCHCLNLPKTSTCRRELWPGNRISGRTLGDFGGNGKKSLAGRF